MTEESACLLRAIRGPVILITVGTLFALDNFTPFGFGRTWPILLVVVGLLNLGRQRRFGGFGGKMRCQTQWGPPRPQAPYAQAPYATTPPPPPPPSSGPSRAASTPPGSYRGSPYEATPGTSGPRGAEPRRDKPFSGPGATP